jgi:hypothetical protein
MRARGFRGQVRKERRLGGGGEGSRKGRQDITHPRISPKAAVFQQLGAGASVGERGARKKKTKDFNDRSGTIGLFGPESGHP